MAAGFSPSRRALLVGVAAAGYAMPGLGLAAGPGRAREVVSFHMDQPFLDPSGRGAPFVPPAGAGVALPEAVFLHHPYL